MPAREGAEGVQPAFIRHQWQAASLTVMSVDQQDPTRLGGPGAVEAPGRGAGAVGEDVLTHAQLLERSARAAAALSLRGVRPRDQVAVVLPMCLESVVVTLACLKLGAIRLTLPVGGDPGLVGDRVRRSGARLVICAGSCLLDGYRYDVKAALDRVLAGCPEVAQVLVVSQLPRPVPWTPGRDAWWHEAVEGRAVPSFPPSTLPVGPGSARRARPYAGGMTGAENPTGGPSGPAQPAGAGPDRSPPTAELRFDDPLTTPSRDDTDHGWGERPAERDGAADLLRFLDEKPPHHL